ncbi:MULTISPECIES: ABC transporter permease [unclassified Aureimonas]|uniref:ABC transporter permease n=1 Tax=unclassified Aureimonas TaxID=2615206 RepID=UPI0006FC3106|nr:MULTISPECIES: ABC transporter permease [unclassified Aureimonas]KQT69097.1 sugar ABC transporter permease [Aureimonas sp. Leaf460]KQT69333.1 sugar ABC transporter permease [Aureimonas sp. Leaf427]
MAIDLTSTPRRSLFGRLGATQEAWIAVAILVLGLLVTLVSPKFATSGNLLNVLQNACFIGIMALGMTPVIISGGIDISVGSILGLCGIALGIVLVAGWPLPVAIPAILLLGALCGAFNGAVIAYLKLPPFVVTLATLSMGRSLALVISQNTVFYEFGTWTEQLLSLGGGKTFGLPNVIFALIAGIVVLHLLLTTTRWGRYVYAVGGNEHAARLCGIPVELIKVSTYAFSGLMAAVAAIFLVGWLGAVTNAIGTGYELQVIAATVIGGASLVGGFGTAIGAAIGAVLVEVIRNSLLIAGVNPFWQGFFVGSFILGAVLLERVRSSKV